jgi:lipoprotein-anchoring transpeptidase ErfK/SrfK
VKLAAPILLIICSLAATQAFAEDAVPHPLTRAGCDKAGLVWNDNANVCDVAFGEAEAKPEAEVPVVSTGQPLTRKGCDLAGMHWNDFANVCDEKLVGETAEAKTTPTAPTILITIDKAAQTMTVSVDGKERYDWPVSTGRPAYSTPSGIFTPTSMNKIWYSKQWDNAPMPHAIFFTEMKASKIPKLCSLALPRGGARMQPAHPRRNLKAVVPERAKRLVRQGTRLNIVLPLAISQRPTQSNGGAAFSGAYLDVGRANQ